MGTRVTRRGFLAAGASACVTLAQQKRPNVVLVMTDDQGWGDTGYNGHPLLKTPNLDAMAAAGLRFDRFYAAYPVCSPTRASVLTGRHPTRYRCFSWGCVLPRREVTIAEALQRAGYATGHFGKWHLGEIPGQAGPSNRANFPETGAAPGEQGFEEWYSEGNWFDLNPVSLHHNGKPVGKVEGETSDIVMGCAIQWIKQQTAAGKPFFAVVWFPSPHGPYKALEKDKEPYLGKPGNADFLGEMAAVDRNVGLLRDELRRLGVHRDTLLWFNSDNGAVQAGSTGGLSGAKSNLMEGGIRVPGIVEWPARIPKPFVTEVPAGTVDIFPTVMDCLGVKAEGVAGPIDGISLKPLFEGRMKRRPSPLCFGLRDLNGNLLAEAIIDNEYKLYRGPLFEVQSNKAKSPKGEFLFQLSTDPNEKQDVATSHPEKAKELAAKLAEWEKSVERDIAAYPKPVTPA